ncbi:MAG: outer membrane beta-barrel protein [Bacteroidetes bacterium]|nr:outer membrane beta-barrel protein [Bacteroidota bacterium]
MTNVYWLCAIYTRLHSTLPYFHPDGGIVTTFENLSESRNYGPETILNGSPYKWWSLTFSTNLFKK